MSQDMHNQQVKVKTDVPHTTAPAQGSNLKSRFNDAEYERWSEKIKNRNSSKNK